MTCFYFQTQHRFLHKCIYYKIGMLISLNNILGIIKLGNESATLNERHALFCFTHKSVQQIITIPQYNTKHYHTYFLS